MQQTYGYTEKRAIYLPLCPLLFTDNGGKKVTFRGENSTLDREISIVKDGGPRPSAGSHLGRANPCLAVCGPDMEGYG